jgi:hypothetical protein
MIMFEEAAMTPWEKLLEQPHSRGHFVELYEADEGALTTNVGFYLWEGPAARRRRDGDRDAGTSGALRETLG